MMGKKLKTLDSVVPCDVFDKVLLESHQAATVVLLLESPEDDVVIKACAAIYRFSEKCDENKLTLLSIDSIIERLLVLLLHEERIIRRNACMAVASVSQHHDARKYLRKFKFAIPRLIQLIALEDDTVVREFGTLCLTSLVGDFTGKTVFSQHGGLGPVVTCLSSHDPDVVKNAIETLSLVLQDYEAKAGIRDIPGGLAAIIALLKSEFPIIQYFALLALASAAEDAQNRAMLRDLSIAREIVDYLTRSDTTELHVFAIILLSNCLDDYGIVKLFKEVSGLQLLISYITEKQTSAADEDKLKEKEAKPKKEKEESRLRGKGIAEPNIAVVPDIKEHIIRAIARAARYTNCQKVFHEGEIEKKLLALLAQEKNPSVHVSIVLALGVMAQLELSRDVVSKLEGLDAIVKLAVKKDNLDLLEVVTLACANLSANHYDNSHQLLRCGAIPLLISLLSEPRELTASHAATALANMAPHGELCYEITQQQAVPALISTISNTESSLIQSRCLWALASLLVNADAQNQFVEGGGLEPLVHLLQSGDTTVLRNVSWVLSLIAVDESLATEMCKLGCLEALRQIQLSVSKQNRFSELALARLCDSQLSAKYAYTGFLSAENLIADGFYDVGQLKSNEQLKALEDYGKEDISDRRPIIVINPKPEVLMSVTPAETELTEKSSRAAVQGTGRSSRTGAREPKSKRGAKEKEDKHAADKIQASRDEELSQSVSTAAVGQKDGADKAAAEAKEQQVFTVPTDPTLLHYIENVTERVHPLPTSEEQATALAKFVSEKMGGAVATDQLPDFDYQTHITQLKNIAGCNVIALGNIRTGFFCHRALLYKVLADRIGLQCALVRGDYSRAWNEVILPSIDVTTEGTRPLDPKAYVVDVMYEPGRLIDACSCEALAYMTAYNWSGKC